MKVPGPDHPVWRRLVNAEVPFQPSFLGACMLLTSVRADRHGTADAGRTVLHMEQLRTLYAQNRDCRSVQRDLAALRLNEIFMADPDCGGWFPEGSRRSVDVPPPDHPVWNTFVTGEVLREPSFLGARVFLAHARAELRQPGAKGQTTLHTVHLRALYARNAECRSVQRDLAQLLTRSASPGRSSASTRRRRYTMTVVAADGSEHDLPADTVTRDEPAPGTRGPYVPLAFRAPGTPFYVCSARWAGLTGVPLRLRALGRARGRR